MALVTLGSPSPAYTHLRYIVFDTPGALHQLNEIEYFGNTSTSLLVNGSFEEPVLDNINTNNLGTVPTGWSQTGDEADYRNFERCNAKIVELAPNSPLAWWTVGGSYAEAFNESARHDSIDEAVKALRRAVELYPNSPQFRADLALAMLRAGDVAGFERQRKIALRLDRITPHSDKKIHEETRKALEATPHRK